MGRCIVPLALVAACLAAAAPAFGARRERNGRIAFEAPVGSVTQVFTMRSDGRGVSQLTRDPAGAANPDWLTSGGGLVYARTDGLAELVNTRGGRIAEVSTQEPITDPSLSADGRQLVMTVPDDGLFDGPSVYVVNVDGSGIMRLAPGSDAEWSPNGHWIAYVSTPADSGCPGIRLMRPDGSDNHPVAEGLPDAQGRCHDSATDPSFSPNSRRVVYVASGIRTPHRANGSDLYSVSIRGGDHRRLTRDDLGESSPVFSPDGRRVVFSATGGRGRQNGTFTISAGGGHRRRIGPPRAALSWQPLPAG
jgi:Tol biopolymer transport system component